MDKQDSVKPPNWDAYIRTLFDGFQRWLGDQFTFGEEYKVRKMEQMERALAFADVVALAAMADGDVSSDELMLIHEAIDRFATGNVSAQEALRRWRSLGDKVQSLDQLKRHIRYVRNRLTHSDRKIAMGLVRTFVTRGSGALDPAARNYRTAYQSSPGALLEAFEDAMWN